ncbi:MAG: twin-arginine translocation signal domain-containing protein, partial [Planctomycetota bacterium]|nr:twin-arginine translocation signal domain-containing protein [Planctomycetota bacterium]
MSHHEFGRRDFLKTTAAGVSTCLALGAGQVAGDETSNSHPESLVKVLFESLNDRQKKAVCFDWDHQDGNRGLLRTHVSNNWHITSPVINSEFFNAE